MKTKVIIFISALSLLAVAGTQFATLGRANPFTNSQYSGKTVAPSSAPSPLVQIFSPENKKYNTDSITLNFNASVEAFSEGGLNSPLIRGMRIAKSDYTVDWLLNSTQIDLEAYFDPEEDSNRVSVSLNLTGVPEGNHVVRVWVFAVGSIVGPFHWYTFETVGYSWINFAVDTIPPRVSVFPIGNTTYSESEPVGVLLNFTLTEPASKISYVLDGQDNITIDGNTTLCGLSKGAHTVTVFAWDTAGNVGCSEAVIFTVLEPFPTLPLTAVSIATISMGGAGLLVYFKKRSRRAWTHF